MEVGTKCDKQDLFSVNSYRAFKKDYLQQMYLHSIWTVEETKPYEIIRGSSFCAVKANIPNRFKEVEE